MIKVLTVLLWPAAVAGIACAAVLLTRRAAVTGRAGLLSRPSSEGAPSREGAWRTELVRLIATAAAGGVVVYGVMALLGLPVVHNGPSIDRPVYEWTISHQLHVWSGVMKRLTKIGDTWTTWGAAGTAAACLAASWRRDRWVPPVALGMLVLVDHFATLALRHTFERVGPPNSPFGTYPSGGCDRVVAFYGLIAYLIWREHSGTRRGAIIGAAAVAALAFNEAYSRAYLTLHWLTDILSGCLYGGLLLVVFMIAVRGVTGPSGRSVTLGGAIDRGHEPAPDPASASA